MIIVLTMAALLILADVLLALALNEVDKNVAKWQQQADHEPTSSVPWTTSYR